jgi:uncharacterized membrane protein YbhN (UPF0104 family)
MARPGTVTERRALLSLCCLTVAATTAAFFWPSIETHVAEAAQAAGRGDKRLLSLAGLLFAAAPVTCGLAWHVAIVQVGGRLGKVDACARYGVGSLINSFAPAHFGDIVRTALLLEALPAGGRSRIIGCFGAVQATRLAALAALVMAASVPVELAPLAALLPLAVAFGLRRRAASRLLIFSLLGPAAKVGAVAAVLAGLGVPSPLMAALAVVPALELAALLPITPGNIGIASGAAAFALHASGLPLAEALGAAIVIHAVETAAGILYGTASALVFAAAAAHASTGHSRSLALPAQT